MSGSIHVKMSHCWRSHVAAHFVQPTFVHLQRGIQLRLCTFSVSRYNLQNRGSISLQMYAVVHLEGGIQLRLCTFNVSRYNVQSDLNFGKGDTKMGSVRLYAVFLIVSTRKFFLLLSASNFHDVC